MTAEDSQQTAIIVGCGGVGSHLAYFLSKRTDIDQLILIDGDKIEEKNLERQLYTKQSIGQNKAKELKTILEQFSPNKTYIAIDKYIENEIELQILKDIPGYKQIFGCTDNPKSKELIDKVFAGKYKLQIGCDKKIVEIGAKQKGVWTIGNGYNSTQDIESNIYAAILAYTLATDGISIRTKKTIDVNKLINKYRTGALA